jgi:hypothetical protein
VEQVTQPRNEENSVDQVIPLTTQIEAKHPDTGKPITIVGVDTTRFEPRLVIIHRGPRGIFAEVVDYANEVGQ